MVKSARKQYPTNNDTEFVIIGEVLVDLFSTKRGAKFSQASSLRVAPGGAPANVAVGLLRLGVPGVAFVGRVGDDPYGHELHLLLENEGADVSGLRIDPASQTRLAFVETLPNGDRHLAHFTKILAADSQLQPCDLNESMIETALGLHFGSILQIAPPSSIATERAIQMAKAHSVCISYDPNIRDLWPSQDECHKCILQTLPHVDILKMNRSELYALTGASDLQAANQLKTRYNNLGLVVVTLDAEGAYFVHDSGFAIVPSYSIKLREATGAGDAFMAALLAGLRQSLKQRGRAAIRSLTKQHLKKIVRRANAAAALACTKVGAIPALPTKAAVDLFMGQNAPNPVKARKQTKSAK